MATEADPFSNPALYPAAHDALKAVRDDYLYWTGKLTETSFQLCLAVLAANWAVFGSVDKIVTNQWSKFSVFFVVLNVASSLFGAWLMGGWHRARIEYAEESHDRWHREFEATKGRKDPFPFTASIENLGKVMRATKTWLPLLAGGLFFLALFD